MGQIVDLQSQLAALTENSEFVADCCRFAEELLTEAALRKKYRLAESSWEALGSDDRLVEAIEAEKIRRIRDGSSKRERAQLLVVKAPDVAASIMNSTDANDKHRLDACKVLNDFAANGPQGVPAADRFIIQINLGADTLTFNKSIAIDPNDIDPGEIGTAPRREVVIANKPWDSDGG